MLDRNSASYKIALASLQILADRGRTYRPAVKEVCAKAKVNRTSFYYHFRSVDEAIWFAIDAFTNGAWENSAYIWNDAASENPEELDLATMKEGCGWHGFVAFVFDHQELATALIDAGFNAEISRAFKDIAHQRLNESIYFYEDTASGKVKRLSGFAYDIYAQTRPFIMLSCIDYLVGHSFADEPEEIAEAFDAIEGIRIDHIKPYSRKTGVSAVSRRP